VLWGFARRGLALWALTLLRVVVLGAEPEQRHEAAQHKRNPRVALHVTRRS
jgi:hypothetical protein